MKEQKYMRLEYAEKYKLFRASDDSQNTGKFRGAVQVLHSLKVTSPCLSFMPVVLQIKSKYGSFLFISDATETYGEKTRFYSKYKKESSSNTYGCIQTIDPFRFMPKSWDAFVKILKSSDFAITKIVLCKPWEVIEREWFTLMKLFKNQKNCDKHYQIRTSKTIIEDLHIKP